VKSTVWTLVVRNIYYIHVFLTYEYKGIISKPKYHFIKIQAFIRVIQSSFIRNTHKLGREELYALSALLFLSNAFYQLVRRRNVCVVFLDTAMIKRNSMLLPEGLAT
jgi:hypothetical protein